MEIRKHFKTLRAAENFHNRLYGKYDHVRAIRWPLFSEDGVYAWDVRNPVVVSK